MNFSRLKIVDKFIFSQVFQATFVCLFLFVIVWIAPEILVRIMRRIFIEGLSIQHGLLAILYELPKVLSMVLPISILLGSLFTFDKLSKSSELAILRGVGLSFTRIMAPAIVLGVVLSALCFYVGDKLMPMASNAIGEWKHYNIHFVYIQKDDKNRPKQGVIVSNFTPQGIKNVIVINFAPDTHDDVTYFKTILFAPYALKFDDKWLLPEATEHLISENGIFEKTATVKDYSILQGSDADDIFKIMRYSTITKDRGFTNLQMRNYIKLLRKHGFEDECNSMLTKFYKRFLHPLTCLLFAIIGCLLGFSPPRSVRLVGFTIAAALLFLYYITMQFFDLLAAKGVLFPFVSASLPIFGFIAVIFITKRIKDL